MAGNRVFRASYPLPPSHIVDDRPSALSVVVLPILEQVADRTGHEGAPYGLSEDGGHGELHEIGAPPVGEDGNR